VLNFVGANSFLQLLLANVTPWTHSVADYFYVKLGHPAQRWPEHANVIWGTLRSAPRREHGDVSSAEVLARNREICIKRE